MAASLLADTDERSGLSTAAMPAALPGVVVTVSVKTPVFFSVLCALLDMRPAGAGGSVFAEYFGASDMGGEDLLLVGRLSCWVIG